MDILYVGGGAFPGCGVHEIVKSVEDFHRLLKIASCHLGIIGKVRRKIVLGGRWNDDRMLNKFG